MITRTGPVNFSDINTELGYSSTQSGNISNRLSTMGETTNPDSFSECRGYDDDWPGWLECVSCTKLSTDNYRFSIDNRSTEHSYSGTLYYQIRDGTSTVCDSSVSVSSISAGDNGTEDVMCVEFGYTPDNFYWRFDTGVSWNDGGSIIT